MTLDDRIVAAQIRGLLGPGVMTERLIEAFRDPARRVRILAMVDESLERARALGLDVPSPRPRKARPLD